MRVNIGTRRQIPLGQTTNWTYTVLLYMFRGILIPLGIPTKFVSWSCPNLAVTDKMSHLVEQVLTSTTM